MLLLLMLMLTIHQVHKNVGIRDFFGKESSPFLKTFVGVAVNNLLILQFYWVERFSE